MAKRILITGATGYTGQFMLDALSKRPGIELFGTFCSREGAGPAECQFIRLDITSQEDCNRCIETTRPHVVINAAAISSPAVCEKSAELALQINCPTFLIEALKSHAPEALFIQMSTDQVFDGTGPPYTETSSPNPINVYGRSKLQFEQILQAQFPNHCILRISLIVGFPPPRPCGKSSFIQFLDEKLAKGPVDLFSDEIRSSVSVTDVVEAILSVAGVSTINMWDRTSGRKLYHLGGPVGVSRADMGAVVAKLRGHSVENIVHVYRKGQCVTEAPYPSPIDISMASTPAYNEILGGKEALRFDQVVKLVFGL